MQETKSAEINVSSSCEGTALLMLALIPLLLLQPFFWHQSVPLYIVKFPVCEYEKLDTEEAMARRRICCGVEEQQRACSA